MAYDRIGVFKIPDENFQVIFDKTFFGDVSEYRPGMDGFQILASDVDTEKEAKRICDFYRRSFILQQVREMKHGNQRRYY